MLGTSEYRKAKLILISLNSPFHTVFTILSELFSKCCFHGFMFKPLFQPRFYRLFF